MKLKITVALIIAIVALTACRSSKEKAAFVEIPSENSLGSTNAHRNIENIYYSIPLLNLPLEHGNELIGSFTSLKPLDENTYRMLTDIGDMRSYYNGTNRAFRLPAKNGLSFLITGYKKDNKEWFFELYSLSDKLSPKDCLLLSSAEAAADGKSRIVQSFRITDDYRVVVAKHLNNTLIEQLTYMPDANGIFEELRDGKTQTVAFESYDGIAYFVESFSWDYDSQGGLIKKNLRTTRYRLAEDGSFSNTDEQLQTVVMTITPQSYRGVPEKVQLTISNESGKTIRFGADYEVEKNINGKWTKLDFTDDIMFIAIMYGLEPGGSASYDIYLYPDKLTYGKGEYRINKSILSDQNRTFYYASFSIHD